MIQQLLKGLNSKNLQKNYSRRKLFATLATGLFASSILTQTKPISKQEKQTNNSYGNSTYGG
jgi:hypothetical protein